MLSALIVLLPLIFVGAVVLWVLIMLFRSGESFVLDPPRRRFRELDAPRHKTIFLVRWGIYAALWCVLLMAALLLIASLSMGSKTTYELPDVTVIGSIAAFALLWYAVMRRRVSLRWPCFIALLAIIGATLYEMEWDWSARFLGTAACVVMCTGLGKLIIQLWGRRNILAGSSLRAVGRPRATNGLVEVSSDE